MPKSLPVIDMSAPVCCAPVAAGPMSDEAALEVALRLKALADPVRVKIMSLLFCSVDGETNSGDLAAALGISESTVSHHLKLLAEANLVHVRQEGRQRFYTLNEEQFTVCCGALMRNFAPTYADQSSGSFQGGPIDLIDI